MKAMYEEPIVNIILNGYMQVTLYRLSRLYLQYIYVSINTQMHKTTINFKRSYIVLKSKEC